MSLRYDNETYNCPVCKKTFNINEIEPESRFVNFWKCPVCKLHLHIRVYDESANQRRVVIRKHAEELVEGDFVIIRSSEKLHKVYRVSKVQKGYNVTLEGHGPYPMAEDAWVNVQIGTWSPSAAT